jgi:poly(3-hydroxyoctanoate) depolymerase
MHTSVGPVLFLPGTSARGSFWDPVRELLIGVDSMSLDWPGLGDVPADPSVNGFDNLVELVVASIDRPCALVGQSMGGYIAARVAIERPDLVTHLVLAVTSAGIDRSSLGLPEWRPSWSVGDPGSSWVSDPQPPFDALIGRISAPTLLLWASDDLISPVPIGRCLNEMLPSSELVVYPSDDHWVVLEFADDVAFRIARHLAR